MKNFGLTCNLVAFGFAVAALATGCPWLWLPAALWTFLGAAS